MFYPVTTTVSTTSTTSTTTTTTEPSTSTKSSTYESPVTLKSNRKVTVNSPAQITDTPTGERCQNCTCDCQKPPESSDQSTSTETSGALFPTIG